MNISQSLQTSFSKSLASLKMRKGILYILIFIFALVAFEVFNFSTTDFALSDLLGDLNFAGVRWATLLTIAFCGIDFAGIARLFAPQSDKEEQRSVWFLFGAWILAATMNAILTWWGVVMAMQSHSILSAGVVDVSFMTRVVPIFIALMVWVIRILLIGTLSRKGDRFLKDRNIPQTKIMSRREYRQAQSQAAQAAKAVRSVPAGFKASRPGKPSTGKRGYKPEPKYIPMQDEAVYRSLKASG
ncbi:MAG: hypothetical protein U9R53_06200 [Chloroflexota bacterium]|nr:hypothetical protein [Chloroflexota bacterium]